MVHLGQMRHLVRDDVVDHRLRAISRAAERQSAARRAATPAAPGVAHPDPRDGRADTGGERRARRASSSRARTHQMVAHPARQMDRVAAHADLAIGDGHRRRRLASNQRQMRCGGPAPAPSRPRQTAPGAAAPRAGRRSSGACPARKRKPNSAGTPCGKHQLDPALGRIDAQPDPPRPRADPDRRAARRGRAPPPAGRSRRASIRRAAAPGSEKRREDPPFRRLFWNPAAPPASRSSKLSANRLIAQAAMIA